MWRALRYLAHMTALCAGMAAARSEPLSIINIGASALNCVYDTACGFVVADTVAPIQISGIGGRVVVQTRTFTGSAGSPAAAMTGYGYRVNLTGAVGSRCVSALKLPFTSISKIPYIPDGPYADVFVVATGDLGSIGLASADKAGDTITFTFSKRICADPNPGNGESSLFFGLTSSEPPRPAMAQVDVLGDASANVAVRAAVAQVEEPKPKPEAKSKSKRRSRSSAPRARPLPRP